MSWDHIKSNWKVGVKGGYIHTWMAYDYKREVAPDNWASMTRSRSKVNTFYGQAEGEYSPSKRWFFTANVSLHQHLVRSEDKNIILQDGNKAIVGYDKGRVELSGSLSAKWQPIDRMGLSVVLREEMYGDKWVPLIPAFFIDGILSKKGNIVEILPMKKFCAILFSFVLVLMLALPVAAEDAAGESDSLFDTAPALTAPAGYVVNLDTNIVVYEKNSETQLSAASLTKMMTTLLLLENYQDQLDSISLTAPSYIYDLIWEQSTNASTADIRRGETQSLRNLLYAMLLPSGNEAAYIVADYMGGGSIDNFVAMMNDEAKAVGCTGTTFVDPCGLNPNNITTARDAYLILRALTAYDVFATVIATPSYDMGTNDRYTTPGTYIIQNTDKLVTNSSYHRDYTRGGKTGSLGEWQNFAGWHSQNGESYISVLLNVPYDADPEGMRPALAETGTIMDWVFDTYTIAPALDTTQPITEVRVAYSTQTDTVMLYPADNMMTLLPAAGGAALTEPVFNVPDELAAPIRQGDVVGTVTLTIQGEVIGTADLIAGSDVSRNQVLYTLSRVSLFFSSTYFKVVIALTIFVVGCYGIYIAGRVLLASRKTR